MTIIELVAYLSERKNKSFWNFLSYNRSIIVTSSKLVPLENSRELDNSWAAHFLTEARNLRITECNDLVNTTKSSIQALYFCYCLSGRGINHVKRNVREMRPMWYHSGAQEDWTFQLYVAEGDRIYFALAELSKNIIMIRTELARITDKWEKGKSKRPESTSDISGDVGNDFNKEEGTNNSVSSGARTNYKVQRKNKKTPPLTREVNPRNKRRVNYNEGSPLRKRCPTNIPTISVVHGRCPGDFWDSWDMDRY
ncbi:12706_t:CDS:2 [Funneliformis geosporum]|uniref:6701_t:CDS:1 n=1 Tax=Funneliformis geosporum TaxID=1117311 RepID=A0A9W4SGZ8_9GLOM|nr:12706_t:CDS:2 [Funneliformis geosporum]CAI2168197.1 6701_t:CDS:2 [Funneliformis geosporum]